ncbi:ABC transporter ATP-binding protein [Stomatohabitans albus]|uniref:ABC transporter ATP-binding protein n=1 Tax=Stomatohabitans albus TaxID=3110766 RepID=UPI00300C6FEB
MSSLRPITPVDHPIVETERLRKVYGSGDVSVTALHDVDVTFGRGQFTAIMGPSGSGKSTLMHCTAGLDSISSGVVNVNGALVSSMSAAQRTTFRRDNIGFIFQAFNLIPSLSAQENITLPSDIAGRKIDRDRFDAVISALGIGNRLTHRPAELSGGQQQRVACARALVSDAAVVFADEPTGNLDSEATDSVLGFIRYAVDELGQSVIMVTHEPTAAAWADRVVFLRDGEMQAEMRSPTTDSVLDALRTFSAQGRELASPSSVSGPYTPSLHTVATPSTPPSPIAPTATSSADEPQFIGVDQDGDKAFMIPGLGRVTVSGDVHVHVYDKPEEPLSSGQITAVYEEAEDVDQNTPSVPPPGIDETQDLTHATEGTSPETEQDKDPESGEVTPPPSSPSLDVPVEHYGFTGGEES